MTTIICDRCGKIMNMIKYRDTTAQPEMLYECECGHRKIVIDKQYEKFKKEVIEIVNNLNIIDKEIIIRDH
jgi:DNA-directed RNA polymerase subunit RPC12/RpoP